MRVPEYVHGNIAPVITAFKDDETFDEVGQRNLFDYMLEVGSVSAFFCRSGMGQMIDYLYEDVQAMAKCACKHLAGRMPIIMNCSGPWDGDTSNKPDPVVYTRQAVELSQYAEQLGADSLAHVIPTGLLSDEPDQAEVDSVYMRHFETVCAAVQIPVFIYHPRVSDKPRRFTPELVARVAEIPNMVGMKVSTVDGHFAYDLIRAAQGKEFHVVTGAEMIYYATLYAGSRAVIGGGCNINPRILEVELERFEQGDHEGVLEAQDSVNKLFAASPGTALIMKRFATDSGRPVGLAARRGGRTVYGPGGEPFDEEIYQRFKRFHAEEVAKYM